MSMRWRWPRQSISKPPCTSPSRCMRAPTPTSSRRSTHTCSSTPARMRPSTCSPVWRSRITASMPAFARSCPSSRPEGPAPTIATWVRVALRLASSRTRLHALAALRVRRRGRGHEREQRPRRFRLARARADRRREGRDDPDRRRQRPEHVDAFDVQSAPSAAESRAPLAARRPARRRGRPGGGVTIRSRICSAMPQRSNSRPARRRSGRSRCRSCAPPAPRAGARPRCRCPAAARRARTATATPERTRSTRCPRPGGRPRAACRSRRAPAPPRRTARRPARAGAASTPPTDSIATLAPDALLVRARQLREHGLRRHRRDAGDVGRGRAPEYQAPLYVNLKALPMVPALRFFEDFSVGLRFRSFARDRAQRRADQVVRRRVGSAAFHLDDEAGRDTLFGGLVASGWHTAAVAMRLIIDSDLGLSGKARASRSNRCVGCVPVRAGRLAAPRGNGHGDPPVALARAIAGSSSSRVTVYNQRGEAVLEATHVVMALRRGALRSPAEGASALFCA